MNRTYAAVDLGSNSFHLLIVLELDGELHVVDKLNERVRLAAGLMDDRQLDPVVRTRALDCLRTFGQRLGDVPAENIRVCGTNTFRKMIDADAFMAEAQTAVGHDIEVISGLEEARLVYQGVVNDVQDDVSKRLVIDIGGGSTECIIGGGDTIRRSDSLYMGCVEYTRRFFSDGLIRPENMNRAIISARLELGSLHRAYKDIGWDMVYGSSGTINAIQNVLASNGQGNHEISLEGLRWLVQSLVDAGTISDIRLAGLKPERVPVFPGGVCILVALFRSLAIDEMIPSSSALREGVIYDLMGRTSDNDVRDHTVRRMQERYAGDAMQADRVAKAVLALGDQALARWGLNSQGNRQILVWAARLHEIGKAISYSGYHRHGSYLIAHSDMVGFSRGQQSLLAALVLGQRRKLIPERVRQLVGRRTDDALKLIVLLRLASRLNRTRSPNPRPNVGMEIHGSDVHLTFPTGWLEERPLTRADLELEASWLSVAGFSLTWS